MRNLMLLFAMAGLALGQNSTVSGPTLGYIFSSTAQSVTPLVGLPGAALSGPALAAGPALARSDSSASSGAILALSAAGSSVLLVRPGTEPAPVRGVTPGPEAIVFNPSGSLAALRYGDREGSRFQIIAGLPSQAIPFRSFRTWLAAPSSIALSDDGWLLIADGSAGSSTIWQLTPGRTPVSVFSAGPGAAVALLPHSPSALVLDPQAGLLYRLADARQGGTATVLAGAPDLRGASALAVSPDGAYAAAATLAGRLTSIDLRTSETASADCACHPDRLQPLAFGAFAVFDGARVWLWETGTQPRLSFLPAGH